MELLSDRDAFQAFADRNRAAYHLSGLEVFDARPGRHLAASYDPRMGKLPRTAGAGAPERQPRMRRSSGRKPGPMNS